MFDASAAVEWLLRTPAGQNIERRIYSRGESLHAPPSSTLKSPACCAAWREAGRVSPRRAQEAVHDLIQLRIRRYPHTTLLPNLWKYRHTLSVYDAAYVVLAETLGVTLLTRDPRLASAPGHTATIELF